VQTLARYQIPRHPRERADTKPHADLTTQSSTRRAFTLIELALVIGIIGTIAAIAVPRYASARATFRSRSAAIRLATDLTHAAALARSKSTPVTVAFTADRSAYDTFFGPVLTPTVESSISLLDSPYFASISPASLPAGHRIVFDGYGQPDTQPTLVVIASGRATSLNISQSGRVTVNSP